VTQFLFAELGTSGSVDGSKRLVIKGRFQQKQIENVLRRYIVEYRLGAHKGREQAVVRHLQLVRVAEIGQRDQDGFLGAGRQAEEDAEVDGTGRVYWATMERACGFVWRHVLGGLRDECMYVQRI
jgi:hypothetical protein